MSLRRLMHAHLGDWQNDLPPAWREFFRDCPALDFDLVPEIQVAEEARIWPGRRNAPLPGAPEWANICRAFDNLDPGQVRVLILGQDPYPRLNRATGRAFEDGGWDEANPMVVADSLRRLLQLAAALEYPDLGISEEDDDWDSVRDAMRKEVIAPPATPAFFDAMAAQGVLFVNAAWTFTSTDRAQKKAHLRIWKPVVNHLLRNLARSDQPVVFLLLGEDARKVFCAADPVCNRSAIVDDDHPRSGQFFQRTSPLLRVNQVLDHVGADRIQWWPLQQADAEEPE
ncbi:uracil-DNA glycosylase family protein [Phaeobacter italicus]|uniref:uracil-DNA glycosylase family protein n=1 Tax=Phaeobacter italicus TaxID=481446 RepID=UPI00232C1BBE|nr:uracil-DNA glycosylase family protein [Phaeobacter italicus]